MTVGSPTKILLRFLLPLFLGSLFQQLYSLADSIIIGRVLGATALAASGSSYPVIILIMSIANGVSLGGLVLVSNLKGASDTHNTRIAISTSIIFCTALGLAFAILGSIFADAIVRALRVPKSIYHDALNYLRIWILSSGFVFLYNGCASICNAIGKPKIPIIFIGIASALNIGTDFLFILGFKMGLLGAAWGSFIALGVASIGLLLYIIIAQKKIRAKSEKEKLPLFSFSLFKKMIKISTVSAFQQSIISIGLFIIQILINDYGTVIIAGYTAAIKIDTLARTLFVNLGVAISSFVSQNVGAKLYDRVKSGYRSALLLVVIIAAFLAVSLYTGADFLVSLFIDSSASPQEHIVGMGYLRTVCWFYALAGYLFVTNGFFRSVNYVSLLVLASAINITSKVVSAYFLSHVLSYSGIWWANPIGWAIGSAVLVFFYFSGKWKKTMKA